MGKGYAEGPAAEERFAELERAERDSGQDDSTDRAAVFGATAENPDRHFIGWRDDVDPDELFATGQAWGLSIVRQRSA